MGFCRQEIINVQGKTSFRGFAKAKIENILGRRFKIFWISQLVVGLLQSWWAARSFQKPPDPETLIACSYFKMRIKFPIEPNAWRSREQNWMFFSARLHRT